MIHLAATVGDPTSIGPEVASQSIPKFLRENPSVVVHLFAPRSVLKNLKHARLEIHDHRDSKSEKFVPGRPNIKSGARALEDLWIASEACIRNYCDALITGPLDKFICAKTDKEFTGHTEFLQKRTKSDGTTMLLASESLRVALVTTHIPLKDVSKNLKKEKIEKTILRTHQFLKTFSKSPKIAVCGLNPHASDRGVFGTEEQKIILPAIQSLKRKGLTIEGPVSPDSFFHRAENYDAVICMYHDQGLIPLKMKYFYEAVNITLGLPFLRTSVDHGTAFDIAGKSKASSLSYAKALEYACQWAKRFRQKDRGST
ncbi:MAG: 4-hydroxythreonine-4-phosphate dehydrogenase PdxA [Deltaproteobacteria bacterium]|nr:4-hydroxythreonine-4-phosphate dehydrogenase PdxA [Deltaproteobacteria bacterium]